MPADPALARTRRLFVLGGYGTIFTAFLAVGLIPYLHSSAAVKADIAASQRQIAARLDAQRQLADVTKEVQFINMQVGNHDRLLPAVQDLGPFMEQLSHELDRAGMKEVTVRALQPITLGKSQQLPIEVGGTCTFAQFHEFLVHLEKLSRMSSVSHLSVDADTPMTGKVTVQLTLSIYNARAAS
jgi:Tfp pilus assembly protein PilO